MHKGKIVPQPKVSDGVEVDVASTLGHVNL